jgi:hypothetical protein
MRTLTELLNNPEEHYPGNFDTPQRANALLTGLCQDAANEIERLNAEVLEQCRINGMSAEREDALRAEAERLNKALTWEQNRSERIGTHGPGCHTWGPAHYECLLRVNAELVEALKRVMDNDCPLTGNPSHAELVEHWEYEKSQGRGEADDRLFALAALAKATGETT